MKNRKWMLAILLTLTVFSAVLFGACGTEEEPPQAGPETGSYYMTDAQSGKEYTIELHDGNQVDFRVKDYDLTGKYTVEGEILTFTFSEAPETVTASLKDDILNVTLDNETLRFWKKISYSISYMADGSLYTKQDIINGKTATAPADPPSGSKVFVGWYTDNAFRNPYVFTQPVRGDLTLYAFFVEPIDPEFKVVLDANYPGAEAEEVETVGGKLFRLPVPERDGYEFAGWWTSMSGDPAKLTARYESQAIYENTTLYAVWKSGAPLVSIDETGVHWEADGVGNNYSFKFTGPDGAVIAQSSMSASLYTYDFSAHDAGEYVAEVTLNGVTSSAYYTNKALAHVSVFDVEGSVLLWNAVPNAQKYTVAVVCGNPEHVHGGEVSAADALSYDFGECEMPEDGIVFTVTAEAEGFISSVSAPYSFKRTLEGVKNISADGNALLTWDTVERATSYLVTVTPAGSQQAKTYSVTDGAHSLDLKELDAGNYTVSVQPVAHGWISPAAAEYSYSKTILASPHNFRLESNTVVWDEVAGADSYEVTVDGVSSPFTVQTPAFELSDELGGSGVKLTVRAMKSGNPAGTSPASDSFTVTNGEMGEVSYRAGYVLWDAVYGIGEFFVKVNEDGEESRATGTQFAITFLHAGENTVYVCGVKADGSRTDWASCTVEVYAVEFDPKGGAPVDTVYKAEGDPISPSDYTSTRTGYTLAGWFLAEEGGDQYTQTTFTGNTNLTLFAHWTANQYTITLNEGLYGVPLKETTFTVTYNQPYTIAPPESNNVTKAFAAWRGGLSSSDIAYTDYEGRSLTVWKGTSGITLYASWAEIFSFEAINGGWQVSKGDGIQYVRNVTVPETYSDAAHGVMPVISVDNFSSCSLLETIRLPNCIKNISLGTEGIAFRNCASLRAIEIYEAKDFHDDPVYEATDGVLLYNNPVSGGKELIFYPLGKTTEAYTIPDGVTLLSMGVFRSAKFQKVTVPASVITIEREAFADCAALTTVEFLTSESGSPLDIRERAFSELDAMTDLTLPDRLASFSTGMIYHCDALVNLNLSGTKGEYSSEDGLLIRTVNGIKELAYYPAGRSGEFTVPQGVTSIGSAAIVREKKYENGNYPEVNSKIVKATIPSWVTNIAANAFKNCTSLAQVVFEGDAKDNQLTIGAEAFSGCVEIKEITLPENLVKICTSAFYGCSLTEITLPASLLEMEAYAFGNMKELETVTVKGGNNLNYASYSFASTGATHVSYVKHVIFGENTYLGISNVFGNQVEIVDLPESNPYYHEVDGVLFNADMTSISFYPAGKTGPFVIPDSVTEIANSLFEGRSQLTEITIPATATVIGAEAFSDCTNLTAVHFATAVSEGYQAAEKLVIGDRAFYNCNSLEHIELPARTTEIGAESFAVNTRLKGIKTITLNDGLQKIGAKAFYKSALTAIRIPASVTDFGTTSEYSTNYEDAIQVFTLCDALESIEVDPDNPKYASVGGMLYGKSVLDDGAGGTKTALTDLFVCPMNIRVENGVLEIPSSVTKIWATAFYYVGNSTYKDAYTDKFEIRFKDNKLDQVYDAEQKQWKAGELDISSFAFYDCLRLLKLELPEGLRVLKTRTIVYSSGGNLETLVLPASLESIQTVAISTSTLPLNAITFRETPKGQTPVPLRFEDPGVGQFGNMDQTQIFAGLKNLTDLTLPERTVYVGAYAFRNTGITHLHLPSSLTEIGKYAFSDLTLEFFEFAPAAEENTLIIGERAFQNLGGISSISLPTVTEIGAYAFSGAKNLASVDFGTKLRSIGDNAFLNSGLKGEVKFPATLQTIGMTSFSGTAGITTLTFAKGSALESIGNSAFNGCTTLTSANLQDTPLCLIGTNAFTSTGLLSVTLPATIETIGQSAFAFDASLETVTFNANDEKTALAQIGNYAFRGTAITQFDFPNSTADEIKLGTDLFAGCGNLGTVFLSTEVLNVNNVFRGCGSIKVVTVQTGHKNFSAKEGQSILYDQAGTSIQLIYAALSEDVFTIPDGATVIGGSAFKAQTGIKTVYIPASVNIIGDNAFQDCIRLEHVIFDEKEDSQLTSIGASAFSGCIALQDINLGQTSLIQTIGKEAFRGCAKLGEIDLSRNTKLTQFEKNGYTFAETTSMNKILLPKSMTFLGTYTFQGSGITSIDLSALTSLVQLHYNTSGTTSVPSTGSESTQNTCLFDSCVRLKEVTLPSSLLRIGGSTFINCTSLDTINTGKIQIFGAHAFENCAALKQIDIHSATGIGRGAFEATGLTSISIPAIKTAANFGASGTGGGRVFANCTDLQSVTIANGFVVLNNFTFTGCTSLTQIEIPGTVTDIGKEAFSHSGLTSVTIPSSVTTIDTGAFYDCKNLTSATFADGATPFASSGSKGLKGPSNNTNRTTYGIFEATNVQNVNLGNRVTVIAGFMFCNCLSLEGLVIPSSVTKIDAYAFLGSGLRSITIPASVTEYGGSVGHQFDGCLSLSQVDFGEGYHTAFASYMFFNCTALESFRFPDGVTTTGESAFQNSGLAHVEFNNITEIGKNTFRNTKFTTLTIPNTVESFKTPNPVTATSGNYAFADCELLEELIIAENPALTDLGAHNFENCTSLSRVVLPDGLVDLGDWTFFGCTALQELTIPATVNVVGGNYFHGSSVTSITIGDGVTEIAKYAFDGDTAITEVHLPAGLTRIGDYAFRGCTSLTSITLPDSIQYLGTQSFSASGLTGVVLPKNLLGIGNGAFMDCADLASVDFNGNTVMTGLVAPSSSGLGTSSSDIFKNCTSLKSIELPTQLEYLGQGNFSGSGLERIDLSKLTKLTKLTSNTTSKDIVGQSARTFDDCPELTEVILPDCLTGIGNYTFRDTPKLKNITFPAGFRTIGVNAFEGSGLVTVTIPACIWNSSNSKNELGSGAFKDCKDLESVTLTEGINRLPENTFSGCSSLKTINIPASLVNVGSGSSMRLAIDPTAFRGCSSLHLNQDEIANAIFSLKGGVLVNESGKIVAVNGGMEFADDTLTVPADVTDLSAYMFEGVEIGKVVLEGDYDEIPKNAFYGLIADELVLPDSVLTIQGNAFENANIGKLVLGEKVATISDSAFKGGTFGEINIPASVSKIGKKTFENATIKSMTFASAAVWTSSETALFSGATLGSISFTGAVTIGQQWFAGVTIPEGFSLGNVVTIDKNAFDGAIVEGTLTIPASVTLINSAAFKGVPASKIKFEDGNAKLTIGNATKAEDALFAGAEFTSVELPTRLEVIGDFAFAGSGLTSVVIPEGVTTIGKSAFAGCASLVSVSLPSTLLSIGAKAFENCTSIKSIYLPARLGTLTTDVFTGWTKGAKIYVDMSEYSFVSLFGAQLLISGDFEVTFDCSREEYLSAIGSATAD